MIWEQDNQQERLVFFMVSDEYLIGFTEGEGMFYIGVVHQGLYLPLDIISEKILTFWHWAGVSPYTSL